MGRLSFSESDKWSFVGQGWQTQDGGEELTARPPWKVGLETYVGQECVNGDVSLAFRTDRAYGDFEARFRFRWDAGHCGAGFVFRARDSRHYYLAHFPNVAQCTRAEHFWALISRVDGNGWADVLQMEMVHGVATEVGMWHDARLTATGNQFQLWVDGRPLPVLCDDSFTAPGMLGFEAWQHGGASASFRNLEILGEHSVPDASNANLPPAKNWHLPYPVDRHLADDAEALAGSGPAGQSCSGLTRTPDGNLLMALRVLAADALLSSGDNGRTWQPVEAKSFPGGWVHTLRNGRLITLVRGKTDMRIAESVDCGKTWSEPQLAQQAPFVPPENVPDMKLGGLQGFLELHDGTLLAFQVGSVPGRGHDDVFGIWEWGMFPCCAFSTRSTDDGLTWSEPARLNGPPATGQKYDLCECSSNMQTREGKVLSLVRPVYSPWMWEVWSDDDGQSWGPATSGPFPCYACCALATENGTLLVSGRMPGLGLYASFDSGMTWKPYRVDTAGLWAMGTMYEVEPNLVFYVYMDLYGSSMRAQFLRIHEDSVGPVAP